MFDGMFSGKSPKDKKAKPAFAMRKKDAPVLDSEEMDDPVEETGESSDDAGGLLDDALTQVTDARTAISDGNEDEAQAALDRIEEFIQAAKSAL